MTWRLVAGLLVLLAVATRPARAQQTIFNVPSPDVLARGEVYGELDVTVRPVDLLFTAAPRVVFGVGHHIELGLNVSGVAVPDHASTIISPTAKWKVHEWKRAGVALLLGDSVFLPVTHRAYAVGNYVYVIAAKRWRSGTRLGVGAFEATPGVFANSHRAGAQVTFEQPITKKVQVAAEWMSGNHASGYVNPGVIIKMTPKVTFYAAYQLGNHGVTNGNHNLLLELGYSFR